MSFITQALIFNLRLVIYKSFHFILFLNLSFLLSQIMLKPLFKPNNLVTNYVQATSQHSHTHRGSMPQLA
jgi:hypothetical protein